MTTKQRIFLQFFQMALWGKSVEDFSWGDWEKIDWEGVADLVVVQTQVGLVVDVWAALPKEQRPPKSIYFGLLAMVADIEKDNKRMNALIPLLMTEFEKTGCKPWLMKGLAVGRLYRKPTLRQPGDIDLLLTNNEQYQLAKQLLEKLIGREGKESAERQHSEFWMNDILIELHGAFSFMICRRCTKHLPQWREKYMQEQPRIVQTNRGVAYLPPLQFEVVFVFAHMMNHLMTGGVGLRQVADCMMLMYRCHDQIDVQQLQDELNFLGLTKFWRVYAAMAVDFLGYPAERMPLYDVRFHRQGEQMLNLIFKTGNFGHLQKEKQLSSDANKWLKKLVTAWGQVPVYWHAGKIFPWDALYCFWKYSMRVLKG